MAGRAAVTAPEDPTDVAFFYALAAGEPERIDAAVMGAAERAFHRWLEDVCLDDAERRLRGGALALRRARGRGAARGRAAGHRSVSRARDLTPFLRRPGNRDCVRVLGRLELWFLRQYDVHHAAVMRHHAEALRAGAVAPDRVLSRHSTRAYLLALLVAGAAVPGGGVRSTTARPLLFDWLAALEVRGLLALGALVLGLPLPDPEGSHLLPHLGAAHRRRHHRRLPAGVPDRRGLGPRAPAASVPARRRW